MNTLIALATLAMGCTLIPSGSMHNNVVIRDLPENVQAELIQQRPNTSQSTRPVHSMIGRSGPQNLAVGESIEIELAEKRSTGYSWRVASCDPEESASDFNKGEYEPGNSNGMMGVGGKRIFTFTPKKVGNVSCTLRKSMSLSNGTYKDVDQITYFFKITE